MRTFTFVFLLSLPMAAGVADNPDVTGQERLFEAWIHGQMAYRGLRGIVVLFPVGPSELPLALR